MHALTLPALCAAIAALIASTSVSASPYRRPSDNDYDIARTDTDPRDTYAAAAPPDYSYGPADSAAAAAADGDQDDAEPAQYYGGGYGGYGGGYGGYGGYPKKYGGYGGYGGGYGQFNTVDNIDIKNHDRIRDHDRRPRFFGRGNNDGFFGGRGDDFFSSSTPLTGRDTTSTGTAAAAAAPADNDASVAQWGGGSVVRNIRIRDDDRHDRRRDGNDFGELGGF